MFQIILELAKKRVFSFYGYLKEFIKYGVCWSFIIHTEPYCISLELFNYIN